MRALDADTAEDLGLVAGAGFEPTTFRIYKS